MTISYCLPVKATRIIKSQMSSFHIPGASSLYTRAKLKFWQINKFYCYKKLTFSFISTIFEIYYAPISNHQSLIKNLNWKCVHSSPNSPQLMVICKCIQKSRCKSPRVKTMSYTGTPSSFSFCLEVVCCDLIVFHSS